MRPGCNFFSCSGTISAFSTRYLFFNPHFLTDNKKRRRNYIVSTMLRTFALLMFTDLQFSTLEEHLLSWNLEGGGPLREPSDPCLVGNLLLWHRCLLSFTCMVSFYGMTFHGGNMIQVILNQGIDSLYIYIWERCCCLYWNSLSISGCICDKLELENLAVTCMLISTDNDW